MPVIYTSWEYTAELVTEARLQLWADLFIKSSLQSCELELHVENTPVSYQTPAVFSFLSKLNTHTRFSLQLNSAIFPPQQSSVEETLFLHFSPLLFHYFAWMVETQQLQTPSGALGFPYSAHHPCICPLDTNGAFSALLCSAKGKALLPCHASLSLSWFPTP